MAFAITMGDVPRVYTYEQAVAFHTKAASKPWRNGGEDHPLVGERKRTRGVRMQGTDVIFRLHCTDVVTWHGPGQYTLNPYPSRSTSVFADNFLPAGHYTTHECSALVIDDRKYKIPDPVTVCDDTPATITPWQKLAVDRRKARALLATTPYEEYRVWWNATYPIIQDQVSWRTAKYMRSQEIMDRFLAGSEEWGDMLWCREATPAHLREAIYDTARRTAQDVYQVKQCEYLEPHATVSSYLQPGGSWA